MRTNKKMVNTCDWLLCCVSHGSSNSRELLKYAERRKAKGLIQIGKISEHEAEN